MDTTQTTHRMPAKDRRDQLLDSALDIFSRKGFVGTTTKEIAAAAGVTEAVIFRHFPSKQALYQAILDLKMQSGELQTWVAEYRDCIARNDDEGLIRSLAGKLFRSYRGDQRCGRVLLFAALEGHEQGLAYNRQMTVPITKELTEYIARRQREGAFRRELNPGMILATIAGIAHYGMMTAMFGYPTQISEQEAIDNFASIILNGLRITDSAKQEGK